MLFERIRYQNHLGEILDFGKNGLYVEENDLRNFAWEVQTNGDRITGFRRGMTQKTLPVSVAFRNPAYVKELKRKLFEFCEKDVIAERYGKIIVGEYFFECYVTSSAKADILTTRTSRTSNSELRQIAHTGYQSAQRSLGKPRTRAKIT